MKIIDIIILSLAVGFFIIGVHQLFIFSEGGNLGQGLMASYWIFMLSSLLLIWFKFRRNKQNATSPSVESPITKTKSKLPKPKTYKK